MCSFQLWLWFTLSIISKLLAFGNYLALKTSPKIRVKDHLLDFTSSLESVVGAIHTMVNCAASLALEDPLGDFVALAKTCIRIGHVLLNVDADFDRALHSMFLSLWLWFMLEIISKTSSFGNRLSWHDFTKLRLAMPLVTIFISVAKLNTITVVDVELSELLLAHPDAGVHRLVLLTLEDTIAVVDHKVEVMQVIAHSFFIHL